MKENWNIRSLLNRVKYWCVKLIELVALIIVQKHKTRMFWKCNLSLELITFQQCLILCWCITHKIQGTLCLLCILLSGASCGQRLSFTCKFYFLNSIVVWCDTCESNFYSSLSLSSTVQFLWLSTLYTRIKMLLL